MKKYIRTFLFVLILFLLSGCVEDEDYLTLEERFQMCIDAYMEDKSIDLSYEVKDNYASVEESYQEFVNLSAWVEDTWDEIDDMFSYYEYRYDSNLMKAVEKNNLDWDDVGDRIDKEASSYKSTLLWISEEYLVQIIDVSCEEIQNNKAQICDELELEGISDIAFAERTRIKKDYKQMFISIYTLDYPKQIFHALYPEELFQGALACIKKPTTKESVEQAIAYFSEVGLYAEYAEQIDWAYDQAHELWRCDFGTCQNKGDTKAKNHNGQFCMIHALHLDNGGKLEKKNRPSAYAGVMLPPPDSLKENDSNENKDSSKEESKKEELPDDPYDVYDYYDPEDFYYDNYDDFWDYEDAEDYWNEAWDKVE